MKGDPADMKPALHEIRHSCRLRRNRGIHDNALIMNVPRLGNGVALHAFVEYDRKHFGLHIPFTRSLGASLKLMPIKEYSGEHTVSAGKSWSRAAGYAHL